MKGRRGAGPGYASAPVFLPLLLVFIVLPLAELYVIVQVGGAIGILPTLALLLLASFLGAGLLRSQGRAAWERFNTALANGRVPAREVADGALIVFGGALLLTPGFITDVFGICLLLPPTRAVIRSGLGVLASRRIAFGWAVRRTTTRPRAGQSDPGRRDWDVEGTATEVRDSTELGPGGDGRG